MIIADGARISTGEFGASVYFAICSTVSGHESNEPVALAFFDRSKQTVNAVGAYIKNSCHKGGSLNLSGRTPEGREVWKRLPIFRDTSYSEFDVYASPFVYARDRGVMAIAISRGIGSRYVLTTPLREDDDIYSALMRDHTLPLLREWVPYLKRELTRSRSIRDDYKIYAVKGAKVVIPESVGGDGKPVEVENLICLTLDVTEAMLERVVSEGLKSGQIAFSKTKMKPLELGEKNEEGKRELNAYMESYGHALNANVDAVIHPLSELLPTVAGFAAKTKRIYPQQAAVINGMIALKEAGESYGFLNCGMGCGKTMMAIGTVEGAVNKKWLDTHPGKTLKDMYLLPSSEQPKYRAVVMPPGHLTEKWKREILTEVPGAKVTMIKSLADLEELRRAGKKPMGREWFIIGKDFAKLDSGQGPTPTKIVYRRPGMMVCKSCFDNGNTIIPMERDKKGRGICPNCGENRKQGFRFNEFRTKSPEYGLLCPDCGQMLIHKSAKPSDDEPMALKPTDFTDKTSGNDFCRHCGASLWGTRVKPNGELKNLIWQKVSYKPGKNGKGTATTAFVHMQKGREGSYPWLEAFYQKKKLLDKEGQLDKVHNVHMADNQYSPRKVAPATFIKKYLNGYWDFVVLDEVHKYAGAGSAQMQAAHALVKTGKFSLGLTGTLTNGTAQSLFYLFWMLCPWVMKKKGYKFHSSAAFSAEYGCVEAIYEEGRSYGYGKLRKGKQITPPRVKPGINPVVYSEFLLGHAINMDLSDLSSHMPPLIEKVELVDMPADVGRAYSTNLSILKSEVQEQDGSCLLGEMLNFSLSYPDKPYGREIVLHPHSGQLVMNPANCDEYRNRLLPKEERVVEIVKQELEEGRNCFIFATFTGKEETCITHRLKDIIERECNLTGRVAVLEANKPKAEEREEFIHRQARAGIQVVITNPKICETGLDFCWDEDGIFYNYPSIVFLQPTYELATMMQSSRRHYRLSQRVECRTYWMAYEGTLQATALQIMASKQVAAAAIQGSFSAEGLASMAQGVDPRVMLAKKLADGDNSSKEELAGMFDVIAKVNNAASEEKEPVEKQPLFFEIMGTDYHDEVLETGTKEQSITDLLSLTMDDIRLIEGHEAERTATEEPEVPTIEFTPKATRKKKNKYAGAGDIFELCGIELATVSFDFVEAFEGEIVGGRKKKVKKMSGQIDLLDLLAM